jgi:hypothetical protein
MYRMLKSKYLTSTSIISSLIHATYSKSYTIIYDQFNEAIKIPQKWILDIKQVEFSELLATSIGPLALFFNWKKRHKEEFSEIASGVMASSFVHGDPIGTITSIVVLAYRYDKSSNKQELRNLKWGVIKGGVSIGAFAITIKAMGVSLVSFLVGVCVAAVVRKTVSTLRFFEYLRFIRTLKVKIPKLKKKISRREFLSMKIFEFKNA